MKIKLTTQGKGGVPTKPGHTAVVVPQEQQNATPYGVIPEFKQRAATGLGVVQILIGGLAIIMALIAHFRMEHKGCRTLMVLPGSILIIITGIIGLAAAYKKTRRLIIAFMVLAIICIFISLGSAGSGAKALMMEHRRHHHHRHHGHHGHHPHHESRQRRDDHGSHDSDSHDSDSHEKHEHFGFDEKYKDRFMDRKMSYDEFYKYRRMMMVGHIVGIVGSLIEFAIAVASCAIAGQVVGCCRKRQQCTGSLYNVQPVPPPADGVDVTAPLELSPKLLAEQEWLKYQAPPVGQQMPEYEPDTKPQAEKDQLAAVDC